MTTKAKGATEPQADSKATAQAAATRGAGRKESQRAPLNSVGEAIEKVSEEALAGILGGVLDDENDASAADQDVSAADESGDEPEAEESDSAEETDGAVELAEEGSESETAEAGDDQSSEGEETEGEGDEEDQDLANRIDRIPKLSDEQKEHVQRLIGERLGKATRKAREELEAEREAREAAEAQAQQFQQELEQARTATPPAAAAAPLANVRTQSDLARVEREGEEVTDFCEENLVRLGRNPEAVAAELRKQGVKLTGADGEEDFSPERMEEFLTNTRRKAKGTLQAVKGRRKWLEEEAVFNAKAESLFPWWKQPKSPEYQEAIKVANNFPAVKNAPQWRLMVSLQLLGLRQMQQQLKKRNQSAEDAPRKKAPPAVPGTRKYAPTPTNTKAAKASNARKKLLETGSRQALEEVLGEELD